MKECELRHGPWLPEQQQIFEQNPAKWLFSMNFCLSCLLVTWMATHHPAAGVILCFSSFLKMWPTITLTSLDLQSSFIPELQRRLRTQKPQQNKIIICLRGLAAETEIMWMHSV